MANQPSPDKQAVTYRLHRDLVERVKAAAEQRDDTVTAFVTRALENEIGQTELPELKTPGPTTGVS